MTLKRLKEFVLSVKWVAERLYTNYQELDQTPLTFIVNVKNYEDEMWWGRGIREIGKLKAYRDHSFKRDTELRSKRLINLCKECQNGDDLVVLKYATVLANKFKGQLVGVELGSAYGGNVQDIAELWKNRGKYYGYDTFTGHPKHLGKKGEMETDCMDTWYENPLFGTEKLAHDYQRKVLDEAGLDNAILVKGLVTKNSCFDLKEIHLAFLDMDMEKSMRSGFEAVKDKIPTGGYLLLHDAIPAWHLPGVNKLSKEIEALKEWKLISDNEGTYITVFEKL